MSYASISIDRREAYYERCASLIAADPLGFYCRAEAGRRVQSNIKPQDLKAFRANGQMAPKRALTLAWSNDARGNERSNRAA